MSGGRYKIARIGEVPCDTMPDGTDESCAFLRVKIDQIPMIREAVNSHTALVAERDALREALEPLAEIPIGAELHQDDVLYINAGKSIAVRDVLKARAALSPEQQREGQ